MPRQGNCKLGFTGIRVLLQLLRLSVVPLPYLANLRCAHEQLVPKPTVRGLASC